MNERWLRIPIANTQTSTCKLYIESAEDELRHIVLKDVMRCFSTKKRYWNCTLIICLLLSCLNTETFTQRIRHFHLHALYVIKIGVYITVNDNDSKSRKMYVRNVTVDTASVSQSMHEWHNTSSSHCNPLVKVTFVMKKKILIAWLSGATLKDSINNLVWCNNTSTYWWSKENPLNNELTTDLGWFYAPI